MVAVVDADAYEALVDSTEEPADRAELEAARADDAPVPWEGVKDELGLG